MVIFFCCSVKERQRELKVTPSRFKFEIATKMEGELGRHGLFLDEMSQKIRLLKPDYHQLTDDLVEECSQYLKDAKDFKTSSAEELLVILNLKKQTEQSKMEMIAKRNQLMSMDIHKQTLRNKMQKELKDKRDQLDQIKQERETLQQIKTEQEDLLRILCRR